MPAYIDQLGRTIEVPSTPKRIISTVPSQTELLFFLGLDEKIVGVTKFCIHPNDKVRFVKKVGGTKQLDLEGIKALNPDLIIANKEENERGQVESLMEICPVWISDINDLESALDMIKKVGVLVNYANTADLLSDQIAHQFQKSPLPSTQLRVMYLVWQDPYMAAGKNTFIDDMLGKCGLNNAITNNRYPEITSANLVEANPDVVFLSSEPYPFKQKHVNQIRSLLPSAIIKLVDGELFSWYGSRLLYAPFYFSKLLNEINSAKFKKL